MTHDSPRSGSYQTGTSLRGRLLLTFRDWLSIATSGRHSIIGAGKIYARPGNVLDDFTVLECARGSLPDHRGKRSGSSGTLLADLVPGSSFSRYHEHSSSLNAWGGLHFPPRRAALCTLPTDSRGSSRKLGASYAVVLKSRLPRQSSSRQGQNFGRTTTFKPS